jgi:hypothetical protein
MRTFIRVLKHVLIELFDVLRPRVSKTEFDGKKCLWSELIEGLEIEVSIIKRERGLKGSRFLIDEIINTGIDVFKCVKSIMNSSEFVFDRIEVWVKKIRSIWLRVRNEAKNSTITFMIEFPKTTSKWLNNINFRVFGITESK